MKKSYLHEINPQQGHPKDNMNLDLSISNQPLKYLKNSIPTPSGPHCPPISYRRLELAVAPELVAAHVGLVAAHVGLGTSLMRRHPRGAHRRPGARG